VSATTQVHGLHAVRSVLVRAPQRLRRLMVDARRDDPRMRELLQLAQVAGIVVERLDARQLAGRVGDVALLLVLDSVQDPHNLGACLRTADACGALAVVVPKDRAAGVNPTVRKVAAGAAETTPVATVTNLVRALKLMKDAGLWVVGADMAGEKLAWETDLTGGKALVLGGEGDGLRELTRKTCDALVRLPQVGAVESLNVSVASGMLLYEALRQRSRG
jgi:23S rRNA (guanosine2251-2'-O)-methyltransferase